MTDEIKEYLRAIQRMEEAGLPVLIEADLVLALKKPLAATREPVTVTRSQFDSLALFAIIGIGVFIEFNKKEREQAVSKPADPEAKPTRIDRPSLQLSGRDGNAFGILARARKAAQNAGWKPSEVTSMLNEARSGNYDHLLQTMHKYFDVL